MATYISNTSANTTWVADTTVVTAARLNTENTNLYASLVELDTALALTHDGTGYFNPTVGSDVASANALTLGTGNIFDITGTTAITSIGTKGTGYIIWLQFDGVLTLTHHSTDLVLPNNSNITTAAGDIACLYEYASADWRLISYNRSEAAEGTLSVGGGGTGATTLTDGGVLFGSGTGAITASAVLADSEMIVGDGTTDPVLESGATLRTSIGVGTGDSPQFTSPYASTSLELGHATDTTLTRSAAGILAVEGSVVTTAGKQTIYVPAEAMTPAGTNGCASLTLVDSGNQNVEHNTLDFDASSDEYAHFNVQFPKSWNESTVTFQAVWTSTASDTDGVAIGLQAVAMADGDAMNTAYGTAIVVTDDAQSTAGDVYVTGESSAVTIAGSPSTDEIVEFRVFRDVSDANDDMTEDMQLMGIRLFFTTDAPTDV